MLKMEKWLLSPYLSGALNLCLAAVLGYSAVKTGLSLMHPASPPPPAQGAPLAPQSRETQRSLNITPILNANLFGQAAQEKARTPPPVVTEAPDTKLNLKLKGVLYAEQPDTAGAVIEFDGRLSKFLRIGAEVQHGVVIHSIQPDRVILRRRNNKLETLRLQDKKAGEKSVSRRQNTLQVKTPEAVPNAGQLGEYRREIIAAPQKLYDYIRVAPYKANGQIRGFMVYPGNKAELFKSLGLESGDIITSLNGTALNSPVNGAAALDMLANTRHVQVEILRGGVPQSLSFTLD